jgi:hypothetical protein
MSMNFPVRSGDLGRLPKKNVPHSHGLPLAGGGWRGERHLLWYRFRTLLTYLIAWWGEVPARCLQWEGIITTQRQEIQDILADSPSLASLALSATTISTATTRIATVHIGFPPHCHRDSIQRHPDVDIQERRSPR